MKIYIKLKFNYGSGLNFLTTIQIMYLFKNENICYLGISLKFNFGSSLNFQATILFYILLKEIYTQRLVNIFNKIKTSKKQTKPPF